MAATIKTNRRMVRTLIVVACILGFLGLLALFHPTITAIATGYVLAFVFFIKGIASISDGLSRDVLRHKIVNIVMGVLSLALGFILSIFPLDGAVSLIWVVGVYYLAIGILEFFAAIQTALYRKFMLFLAAGNLIAGILILLLVPGQAITLLAILIGVGLLFRALALFVLAQLL